MQRITWLAGLAAVLAIAWIPSADAQRRRSSRPLVELGRRLFMDPTVSRGAQFSCASCHDPDHGFSDKRVLSVDENGTTARHSQTLIDLKDGVGMHWDGEFDRVRDLLVARLGSLADATDQARELHARHFQQSRQSGPDRSEFKRRLNDLRPPYYGPDVRFTVPQPGPIALRLTEDRRYREGFARVFGDGKVTTARVVRAVEAYVLSIRSGKSAYDRYVDGDKQAMTQSQVRGLELFQGEAGCAACHSGRRFTDDRHRNTGVAFAGRAAFTGKFDFKSFPADGGRGKMSFLAGELGRFKTPTLRDVARHPPYMHDGSLKTLDEVVRYYSKGGTDNEGLDPHVKPLHLSLQQIEDLVAFLHALTSEERPGLGGPAKHRPRATRVQVKDVYGEPIAGLRVNVVPFGDRLTSGAKRHAVRYVTDARGWLSFPFPEWTHVWLAARGYTIGEGAPLPDYVRRIGLIATPLLKTSVRVIAPKGVRMPEVITATVNGTKTTAAVFERTYGLRRHDAIYVAREGRKPGVLTVTLDFKPRGGLAAPRIIDFRGGASSMIDLRPDPGAVIRPPTGGGNLTGTMAQARRTVAQQRAAERH